MNVELFEAIRPVAERVGWTLVHSTWQGVAAAGGLWAALMLMRRASAQARYAASSAAMVLVVAAVVVTFVWTKSTPAPVTATAPDEIVAPLSPVVGAGAFGGVVATPESDWDVRARIAPWLPAVTGAWCAGVVALAAWHFGGWLGVRRMARAASSDKWAGMASGVARRLGVSRAVRVVESASAAVPAVVGFLRPVILLPVGMVAEMSPAQVEAILAHELAHVRRNDYLVNLIQTVVETLLFYHPAVWWVSTQIRRERENCCDDLAVAACNGDRAGYAGALARVEELRGASAIGTSVAPAASGGSLLERVRRLAGGEIVYRRRGTPAAGLVVTLACVLTVIACAQWPTAQAQPPAEKAPDAQPATSTRPTDAEIAEAARRDASVASLRQQLDQLSLTLAEQSQQLGGQHPRIQLLKRQIGDVRSKLDAQATAVLKAGASEKDQGASKILPEDLVAEAKDYRIAPGDLVKVSIMELEAPGKETTKELRVSESGKVSLPYVNEVGIAGKTNTEAEKAIAKAFHDARIIQGAQVGVHVVEARANTFSVIGQGVAKPGQYAITRPDLRLAEALALAGGADAAGTVRVVRGKGDTQRQIEVTMSAILSGDKAVNLVIRPGDMLLVSEGKMRRLRVLVSRNEITVDGRVVEQGGLAEALKSVPADQRARTLVEVGATSEDVPVGRFMNVIGTCMNAARDLGMAPVSNIGVVPPEAAAKTEATGTRGKGESK